MPVFISEKHLKKGTTRQTISDSEQKGFVLRTTPNGVFTYYFQFLNKNKLHPKTKKLMREWHLIGEHGQTGLDGQKWNPVNARKEATRLAGLAAQNKSLKQIRLQKIEAARAGGVTFQQLHDEYFAYCKEKVERRWGDVPRKESWRNMQYSLARALDKWRKRVASEITADDTIELYNEYVAEKHPAQANCTRSDLRTMFTWGMNPKRKYVIVNPCHPLDEEDKAVEKRDIAPKRVLKAHEIRTLWFGLDDPKCPGDRYSKLALKLTLATVLRSGEVVKIPRTGIAADKTTVTIPLKAVKSRRAKGSQPVVQPLNSLAREILDEVFSIGKPDREYAFPKHRNQGLLNRRGRKNSPTQNHIGRDKHMGQQSLSGLMTRKLADKRTRPGRGGINEYLGLVGVTPHVLRRTGATILDQLGYSQALIGKVMTHKTKDKDAAPVTLDYIVDEPIIERPVDPRVEALDKLDLALRKILGLQPPKKKARSSRRTLPKQVRPIKKALPKQPRLQTAA